MPTYEIAHNELRRHVKKGVVGTVRNRLRNLLVSMVLFALIECSLLAQTGFAQVKLGNITVPRDHMIVFVFIGHSNVQSAWESLAPDTNVFVGTHPRLWNFNIADQFNGGPQHAWIPAKEPIHMRNADLIPCYGPGMPFLKDLIATLPPDYYLGIVQNAEGNAELKANYVDNQVSEYGTNLYTQIHDAIVALDTTVTWGGVVTMIGIVERADSVAASNFATNMDTLILRFRSLTKTPNLPFLITQYEKGAWDDFAISLHYGMTIARQIDSIPTFVPFTHVISTDWTVDVAKYLDDSHHFNPVGQIYWSGLASNICTSAGFFSMCRRDTIPPDPPSQVRIDSISCLGAFLSWQASHDNVGCMDYHIVSSQGLDTAIYATTAVLPVSKDSQSVTFTLKAVDLSSNQSSPVTISHSYLLSCGLAAPDSLRVIRSTPWALTVQWNCGPENGVFQVYIADSLVATVDSNHCTINNLTPNSVYPVKVAFVNSKGAISSPCATVSCTTKVIPMAAIPLSVDFAGIPHGSWVPENLWSDTVAHGMLELLPKEYAPIALNANSIDTVMATMFEGEMQYDVRVTLNDYVLTLYLYDPFQHSSARIFTVSVDGASHRDSIISSPGLQNGKPWSELVTFRAIADSMLKFSLSKGSSLLPISSGFTLLSEPPFTVTAGDTVSVGDTMHIRWDCNQVSVGSAIIYVSADSGKSWSMINNSAIEKTDSSWGHFGWMVPLWFGQQQINGQSIIIKITDYNNTLFGTTHCFVRSIVKVKGGVRQSSGRVQITVSNHSIQIQGNFVSGVARIFKLNGLLVTSRVLHKQDTLDLSKLSGAMYLIELRIDRATYRYKIFVR